MYGGGVGAVASPCRFECVCGLYIVGDIGAGPFWGVGISAIRT